MGDGIESTRVELYAIHVVQTLVDFKALVGLNLHGAFDLAIGIDRNLKPHGLNHG